MIFIEWMAELALMKIERKIKNCWRSDLFDEWMHPLKSAS